ncbi:acyltransferase [Ruania alba]|uniref:Transferase hexapeptide (Six repeat-containing protein) n=1 Tax=Ruania alba TaxID=648782 RepID=A0A1H5N452_9MICO|nr:acyltransferase [Ruania alba]SEE96385.1 transferase hexapeptide (six repeat-containing protein) [Ruania alba]
MNDPHAHTPGLAGAELDFNAWAFWSSADEARQQAQRRHQQTLTDRGAELADRSFVSEWAACFPDTLTLGAGSYLAAFSYVTGDVHIGARSSVNAYAVVRGRVRIGDGVRIGAHTSLLGFDHTFAPDRPVHSQPLTSRGITVGEDVYIGSHVMVLDGVTIGAHSVIGAGAVVTKDVPEWSIMVGNPARRVRDRRQEHPTTAPPPPRTGPDRPADPVETLRQLADRARSEATDVLGRCWNPDEGWFTDTPGAAPTVRALCDAVEIADLLGLGTPPQLGRDEIITALTCRQDPTTGLIPAYGEQTVTQDGPDLGGGPVRYHLLCVGYALDLLGARLAHPITAVDALRGDTMAAALDAQPWAERAWGAGDWVDCVGTGLLWNRLWFDRPGGLDTLIGWLHLNVDRRSGMWGAPHASDGLRQPVNGFYRLTRGTFAQFGLSLPEPERAIDTTLAHAQDQRRFGTGRATACDVLDIAHPLWLAGQQSDHRRDEARAWAATQVPRLTAAWHPGQGFGFAQRSDQHGPAAPGLQGTEMWLAITWYLADLLGGSGALGYEPRGVHRPWAR